MITMQGEELNIVDQLSPEIYIYMALYYDMIIPVLVFQ